MRLPFAPRLYAGEGLTSWVARLAVHNYVTPGELWKWLGHTGPTVAANRRLLQQLAEISGLPLRKITTLSKAENAYPDRFLMPAIWPRGALCPTCHIECNAEGLDDHMLADNAFLWSISCRKHGVRLREALHMLCALVDGRAVWTNGNGEIANLGTGMLASNYATLCEAAFRAAFRGNPLLPIWLTTDPGTFVACVEALTDVVNWRGGAGHMPFAYRFDETCTRGGRAFWIDEAQSGTAIERLPFHSVRSRMNTMLAVSALLLDPGSDAARRYTMDAIGNDDAVVELVSTLNYQQISILRERMKMWPSVIFVRFTDALDAAHPGKRVAFIGYKMALDFANATTKVADTGASRIQLIH